MSKVELTLQKNERKIVPAEGSFITYDSGIGELEIKVNNRSYTLDVSEGLDLPDSFNELDVINLSGIAGDVVLKVGEGRHSGRNEGNSVVVQRILTPVQVQAIVETVTAQITGTVAAEIVNQVAANIVGTVGVTQAGDWAADVSGSDVNVINQITAAIAGLVDVSGSGVEVTNQVNIRTLTETIKTAAQGITETRETAASSLAKASHTFTAAAEVYNVPANANRRDLGIVCAAENTGSVLINGTPYERGETFALGNYTGAVQLTGNTADKIYITEVIK